MTTDSSGQPCATPERLIASDAFGAPLDEPVPAGLDVLAGSPTAAVTSLTDVAGTEVGVWEMTPGTVADVEADEVFVALSGRAVLTVDDGEPLDLGPGSVVRLHAGEATTWTVTETLRKVYVTPST